MKKILLILNLVTLNVFSSDYQLINSVGWNTSGLNEQQIDEILRAEDTRGFPITSRASTTECEIFTTPIFATRVMAPRSTSRSSSWQSNQETDSDWSYDEIYASDSDGYEADKSESDSDNEDSDSDNENESRALNALVEAAALHGSPDIRNRILGIIPANIDSNRNLQSRSTTGFNRRMSDSFTEDDESSFSNHRDANGDTRASTPSIY